MGLPPIVGINAGGGSGVHVGVYHADAEYGCAVYCDAADSGPL